MQRREFIGLITAALSFSRPAHAQTNASLPLVGLLMPLKSETNTAKERVAALRKGLQEAGDLTGLFWTKRCERMGLAKELSDAEEAV
jgi:hypothetical protein